MDKEKLGPAERVIQSLIAYTDHMVHNRPGIVVPDARFNTGLRWEEVTHRIVEGQKVVFRKVRNGRKVQEARAGLLMEDGRVVEGGREVGRYQPSGLFEPVAAWIYRQVAEVWRLDNEFAARWASWAFNDPQATRDLKVVLAAFMLCQSRKGDPVMEDGKLAFFDEDFRDVGEAMILSVRDRKPQDGKDAPKDLDAKQILRIRDVLQLPSIAAINRELGFGKSARNAFLGNWGKAAVQWLSHREENPRMLDGLVKAGFTTTVTEIARRAHYKPASQRFFEKLGWDQTQSREGHRSVAIGQKMAAGETWAGLSEEEICQRIVRERPSWKRVTGLIAGADVTRAIMAAAVESGCLSDKDLVIMTPTIEELGLLQVQEVRERWERAVKAADDTRAANIARNVRSKEAREKLQEGADAAVQKAVEEVSRGIRTYVFVDVSGSMEGAIEAAKSYVAKFLQGFPPDRVHVAVFNTTGREVRIPHPSAKGVENAFRGIVAGGGTDYGHGLLCLAKYAPEAGEDALFVFIGDERNRDHHDLPFAEAVRATGLNPMAFGLVRVGAAPGVAVQSTAAQLGIPCFLIEEATFSDAYAIPRTVRALVAATPVGRKAEVRAAPRVSLIDRILETPLLKKPAWAA